MFEASVGWGAFHYPARKEVGNLFGDQLDMKGKEQLLKKLAVVSQNHLVNIVRLLAMVQNRDEPVRTYIWLIFTRTVTP